MSCRFENTKQPSRLPRQIFVRLALQDKLLLSVRIHRSLRVGVNPTISNISFITAFCPPLAAFPQRRPTVAALRIRAESGSTWHVSGSSFTTVILSWHEKTSVVRFSLLLLETFGTTDIPPVKIDRLNTLKLNCAIL